MNDTRQPGSNPIPNTDAPRQPAQPVSPVPQPQPGTQDATRPGQNQRDASQDAAALDAISDEQRASVVQNSGGGADNAVETTDAGQPSE